MDSVNHLRVSLDYMTFVEELEKAVFATSALAFSSAATCRHGILSSYIKERSPRGQYPYVISRADPRGHGGYDLQLHRQAQGLLLDWQGHQDVAFDRSRLSLRQLLREGIPLILVRVEISIFTLKFFRVARSPFPSQAVPSLLV